MTNSTINHARRIINHRVRIAEGDDFAEIELDLEHADSQQPSFLDRMLDKWGAAIWGVSEESRKGGE